MPNATDTLPAPPAAPEAAAPTLSRYALLREVGRGAMSVVYEAHDRHDGKTVAVKVLNASAGAELSRFTQEAQAVAGISHPNVVAIQDTGEEAGRHFLVMEYLRGETLRERLGRGPLTLDQAEPILRQVADALDAVHAQGVVHGDIKPSNAMLLPDGAVKLLDFGIARRSGDTAVAGPDGLIGSPAYMAPEQARGGGGTPASDIWALGVLLYEMLAGRPPFAGPSIPAVLSQVTRGEPPAIPDLPGPAQGVLRRALEKNPARRYPTARALADALRAALPGSQTAARGRRPLWPWALLLLPVLLGLTLVLLSRYRLATPAQSLLPPPAPAVAPPAALPPVVTMPFRPRQRRRQRTATPSARHRHTPAVRLAVKPAARHRSIVFKGVAAARKTPTTVRTSRRARSVGHRGLWRTSAATPARTTSQWVPSALGRHGTGEPQRLRGLRGLRRLPHRAVLRWPSQSAVPMGNGGHRPNRRDQNDPSSNRNLEHYIYSPEGTGM